MLTIEYSLTILGWDKSLYWGKSPRQVNPLLIIGHVFAVFFARSGLQREIYALRGVNAKSCNWDSHWDWPKLILIGHDLNKRSWIHLECNSHGIDTLCVIHIFKLPPFLTQSTGHRPKGQPLKKRSWKWNKKKWPSPGVADFNGQKQRKESRTPRSRNLKKKWKLLYLNAFPLRGGKDTKKPTCIRKWQRKG